MCTVDHSTDSLSKLLHQSSICAEVISLTTDGQWGVQLKEGGLGQENLPGLQAQCLHFVHLELNTLVGTRFCHCKDTQGKVRVINSQQGSKVQVLSRSIRDIYLASRLTC